MRKLLLVTRNFAPTSHVSVERAIKLAKYLPQFGWQPTVLTGRTATSGLPEDPELLDQVAGIEVIRARAPEFSLFYGHPVGGSGRSVAQRGSPRRGALHPKAWLVPDSQLLWYPFAVRTAMRHASRSSWDAVLGTSFPPTAILIAHRVASRLGIPYLADFRDAWTKYHHAPQRPAPLARFERRLESRMIRQAAAVVAVEAWMVEHALAGIPEAERPPLHLIPNGYDEADFQGVAPAELPEFSIVHTGLLRRGPGALWKALARAMQEQPALRGRLHLWQIGFVDPGAVAELMAPPEGVAVHHIAPVPQRQAISYMLGADLLLIDQFGPVLPSKTLQYLRASRPILAFLDEGQALRNVLGPMPRAHLMPRDQAARAGSLIAALAAEPRQSPVEPSHLVTAYSRREIARRFAAVLDAVMLARARVTDRRESDQRRRAPVVEV